MKTPADAREKLCHWKTLPGNAAHGPSLDCIIAIIIDLERDNHELREVARRRADAIHEQQGRIQTFSEILMGREAKIITAALAQIDSLKAQLAVVPPPPPPVDPATIKDAADVQAETDGAAKLGLDANGDPLPV